MKKVLSIALCLLLVLAFFPQGSVSAYAAGKEIWIKDYYKDVFGDPTEEFYFTNKDLFSGTYNSGEADDAPLGVSVVVDDIEVSFILYENGSTKLKNRSEQAVSYAIAVKATDGSKFSAEGVMPSGSDCVEVNADYTESIINALTASEGKVAFYIENEDQILTNYLFTADCGNLKDLFLEEQYQTALQMIDSEDQDTQYDGLTILLDLDDYKDAKTKSEELLNIIGSLADIGYFYEWGSGVDKNYEKAKMWYEKSLDSDTEAKYAAYAMSQIGFLYLEGGYGISQDYEQSLEWYLKAAELGDADAMYIAGVIYEYGYGTDQDYEKALEWYLKAAELGDAAAMFNAGVIYDNGCGTDQDYEKALEWYLKAAELGNANAMYNAGVFYAKGYSIDQDYEKALEWYLKAAELGNDDAMHNAGVFYEYGVGADQDYEKALEFYLKAADLGNMKAKENYEKLLIKINDSNPAAGEESVTEAVPAEVVVMSYADFTAAAVDDPVCVETYVQAKQSWWDDKATIYTQDQDGAYFLYNMACSEADYAKLVPGQKLRVTGYKAEWSGEVEIVDASFELLDGDSFTATPVDVTDLLGKDELVAHQNQLVSFKGMTVEAYDENGAAFAYKNEADKTDDLYFKVSKDGQTYDFCVEYYLCNEETEVYKAVENLKVGDTVDLEGFLYWYEGPNPHITGVTAAA